MSALRVIFLILLSTCFLSSQKGYELGLWVGASQYYGDLNNRINIHKPGLAFGFLGRRNFNDRISMRFGVGYGRIAASDADSPNNWQKIRNLSFTSNIIDVSLGMEFNFFRYIHGSSDEYYTPYIFAGISAFSFNPKASLNGREYALQPLGTEGQPDGEEYYRFSGTWMLGGGYKLDLNHLWSLNFELSYHSSWTDYIDDVSTTYATLGASRGEIAAQLADRSGVTGFGDPGRQRGNSTDNDKFVFFRISIMRYFGRLECPPISRVNP